MNKMAKIIYTNISILIIICFNMDAQATISFIEAKQHIEEANVKIESAKVDFDSKKTIFNKSKKLFEDGLLDKYDFENAREKLSSSELKLEEAKLNLKKTYISIFKKAINLQLVNASLYYDEQGFKHVKVTVKNSTDTTIFNILKENEFAFSKDSVFKAEHVKIKLGLDNKIICYPIEKNIRSIKSGKTYYVDFNLKIDTDIVDVIITYNDYMEKTTVYLDKKIRGSQTVISAQQFSKQGKLGETVRYDLVVERFSENNQTYLPKTINLPEHYQYELNEIDNINNSIVYNTISRIRFNSGETKKKLSLSIMLPEEINDTCIDKRQSFMFCIINVNDEKTLKYLQEKDGKKIKRKEFESRRIPYEQLEIFPKGDPELEISADNYFYKYKIDEAIKIAFNIKNTGSLNLQGISCSMILPLEWTVEIDPRKEILLEIKEDKKINAIITPSKKVVPGDYEIEVKAETKVKGKKISADSKTIRVQIQGKTNYLIGIVIVILLISVLVVIIVFTIKITKR